MNQQAVDECLDRSQTILRGACNEIASLLVPNILNDEAPQEAHDGARLAIALDLYDILNQQFLIALLELISVVEESRTW